MSSDDETILRAVVPPATPTLPGIVLGSVLGRGGMATVYEGLDQGFAPPRRVAVKLMNTEISEEPEFRTRFEHEASLVADFRHDNIVRVYGSGETRGTKYMVMEYLPGGTLAERLARGGSLLPDEVVRTCAQLADALAYAHGRGVVHRDFKPGNVLFTAENKPVLSDFGVAKSVKSADAQLTRHASIIGAPRYMAPEQERGDPVSDRADVYSLGLTMYEMLIGKQPPGRERVLQTPAAGVEIRRKLAPLGPSLAELICRCLLADSEQRPSAVDCAQELRLGSAPTVARQGTRNSDDRGRRMRRATFAGIGIAAVVILAGSYALWPRADSLHTIAPASAGGAVSSSGPGAATPSATPTPTPPPPLKVPEPHDNPAPASSAAGQVPPQASPNDSIALICGRGDPKALLSAAVTRGLHAKVQLTLAADQDAQLAATASLQHEIACLASLARAGFKSEDAKRLQEDAKSLLESN